MQKIGRINAVREIIQASPKRISRLLILQGSANPKVKELAELAGAQGVLIQLVPKKRLDREVPGHQGLVAEVSSQGYVPIEAILERGGTPLLVLLDGVMDPQNLGAVIRSAEGAGAHGVILPADRAAGLTPAVYAVSAGAAEHMPVAQVNNLARAMDTLKKAGLWLVGAEGGCQRMWHEFDYTSPVGLVLGSEGKGLRPLVRSKCDVVLSLPLLGAITSLNVSAAAAVFLYEVVRQRGLGGRQGT
jgi:23S rRNA (guanosine2251-2'-O)-methyltransferase